MTTLLLAQKQVNRKTTRSEEKHPGGPPLSPRIMVVVAYVTSRFLRTHFQQIRNYLGYHTSLHVNTMYFVQSTFKLSGIKYLTGKRIHTLMIIS